MRLRLAALLLVTPSLLLGADVWVVRGAGATLRDECRGVGWEAYAIVHNRSNAFANVRFLHGSNGQYSGPPVTAGLSAGQSRLARDLGLSSSGEQGVLWVDHLEVPDIVVVEGRLDQSAVDQCDVSGRPPIERATSKLRMPVFSKLVPAGQEQVHYGTDLGSQRTRVNVAIYNAGETIATAVVRVEKPLCTEGGSGITRTVSVRPDSIEQFSFGEGVPCGVHSFRGREWASLVTVTVDQPSFSLISTLSNDQVPAVGAAVTAY